MSDKGILLVNLGSPSSPSVRDVRRYLDQFLMDGRVLDIPYPIRRLIVSAFILPSRPKQSAEAYESIWWDEGSPLIVISRRVQRLLQSRIDLPVSLGMRYGSPSIETGIRNLLGQANGNIKQINLIPLYPHFAMSTVETVEVEARRVLSKLKSELVLKVLPPFYQHPRYIEALVASAADHTGSNFDHLLFSYHGLPERHLRKSDKTRKHCLQVSNCCSVPSPAHATCYRHQVFKTTELFVKAAKIPQGRYSVAFQSRLGRDAWLQPFTDGKIAQIAGAGVKRLLVMCPAFVSDCLETLEEIGIRGREIFLEAGGEEFELIPCMNDSPAWIETLAELAVF
jgi:ferrochelatase